MFFQHIASEMRGQSQYSIFVLDERLARHAPLISGRRRFSI
jgi:hypothetical protein